MTAISKQAYNHKAAGQQGLQSATAPKALSSEGKVHLVFKSSDPLLLETDIEGTVQKLLVVSATVQHHRKAH